MIYNFPLNTGINLEAETVAKIAQHPNVCGIKDSSGNIPQAAQIIDQTPKTFHVLVGAASALLPSLAIGSSGGILALGLICAREFCDEPIARDRKSTRLNSSHVRSSYTVFCL